MMSMMKFFNCFQQKLPEVFFLFTLLYPLKTWTYANTKCYIDIAKTYLSLPLLW